MPTLPNLNSLGKLCSSSRSQKVDRVRVKRKSSVKRMSIIEDGHVAEVLYLIPKQYMDQMPYLNPNDYYLSERLNDAATGRTPQGSPSCRTLAFLPTLPLLLLSWFRRCLSIPAGDVTTDEYLHLSGSIFAQRLITF